MPGCRRLVVHIAKRYANQGVELSELISEGEEGLLKVRCPSEAGLILAGWRRGMSAWGLGPPCWSGGLRELVHCAGPGAGHERIGLGATLLVWGPAHCALVLG
jgi:hypothetical protein